MKKKILIVVANYYENIARSLLNSAKSRIKNKYYIRVINVAGAFEIPVTISKNLNKFNGFIALGCVIKGQTPHFDFISKATTDALMTLSISSKKPIGNGVITCLNKKQAIVRSRKGSEAAEAVLSVLSQ
ncbi:6,7-dimethyl-8-ribityllumazine synthase [Pelagibacterales bacterium SAG-MED34]|nr:6,7-dimethyl-8-ribityllumazine synthase [Pelagibacterales bacterium SAG-MED34]